MGHDVAGKTEKTPLFTSINKTTFSEVIHNLLWRTRRTTTLWMKVVKTVRTNVATLRFVLTPLRVSELTFNKSKL